MLLIWLQDFSHFGDTMLPGASTSSLAIIQDCLCSLLKVANTNMAPPFPAAKFFIFFTAVAFKALRLFLTRTVSEWRQRGDLCFLPFHLKAWHIGGEGNRSANWGCGQTTRLARSGHTSNYSVVFRNGELRSDSAPWTRLATRLLRGQ